MNRVSQQRKIEIESDSESLAKAAADMLLDKGKAAITKRAAFALAVSGGSTPKRLFELLADQNGPYFNVFPWTQTHFFWVDERHAQSADFPSADQRK